MFQFVLSMVLITGTIVVSKQVRFLQARNLGYDRENLLYIPIEGELADKYTTLKQQALNMTGIQSISRISDDPTNLNQQTNGVDWEGRDPATMVSFEHPGVGYDLVQTMHLQMKDGRDFSKEFPTDKDALVINETAAKRINYQHPVGRSLTINGRRATIIGVVKDFHFRSLHESIQPMIMEVSENHDYGNILIRTNLAKQKRHSPVLNRFAEN